MSQTDGRGAIGPPAAGSGGAIAATRGSACTLQACESGADGAVHCRILQGARGPGEVARGKALRIVIRPLDMARRAHQEAQLARTQRASQPIADAGDFGKAEAIADQLRPDDGAAIADKVAQLPRTAGEQDGNEQKGKAKASHRGLMQWVGVAKASR